MPDIIAVVQARMGSTRLPGKSLMKIAAGFSLLELTLLRTMGAERVAKTVLATSAAADCDRLAETAKRLGVEVVRGDENDVLSRFILAIARFKPKAVVRVCADNPFVAPTEIDGLAEFFLENKLDYAENNSRESGFPDGLGAEIARAETLIEIEPLASKRQREHVTQYILDNPAEFTVATLPAPTALRHPNLKLDIDTRDDLKRIRSIASKLPPGNAPLWTPEEIVAAAAPA